MQSSRNGSILYSLDVFHLAIQLHHSTLDQFNRLSQIMTMKVRHKQTIIIPILKFKYTYIYILFLQMLLSNSILYGDGFVGESTYSN